MLLASGLTASFAWQGSRVALAPCKRRRFGAQDFAHRLVLAAALAPLQIFVGDLHGLNTLEHQPAKIAPSRRSGKPRRALPLVLFAIPDDENAGNDSDRNPQGREPGLRHDANAELQGIDAFAPMSRRWRRCSSRSG